MKNELYFENDWSTTAIELDAQVSTAKVLTKKGNNPQGMLPEFKCSNEAFLASASWWQLPDLPKEQPKLSNRFRFPNAA